MRVPWRRGPSCINPLLNLTPKFDSFNRVLGLPASFDTFIRFLSSTPQLASSTYLPNLPPQLASSTGVHDCYINFGSPYFLANMPKALMPNVQR